MYGFVKQLIKSKCVHLAVGKYNTKYDSLRVCFFGRFCANFNSSHNYSTSVFAVELGFGVQFFFLHEPIVIVLCEECIQ